MLPLAVGLHTAILDGDAARVRRLLRQGADADAEQFGLRPLHIATQHPDVVLALLQAGADPNTPGDIPTRQGVDAAMPLHIAAEGGHVESARLLLDAGARVDALTSTGWQPIHGAAELGRLEVVRLLLDRGAAVDAPLPNGGQPLHLAVVHGRSEVVQLLMERGADVNAADRLGSRPLHCAARCGNAALASVLLDAGAAVDAANEQGMQPLHCAAIFDEAGAAAVLLQRGAAVDAAIPDDGYQPLHLAAKYGRMRVLQLLIDHGAPLGATTAEGQTAMQLAAHTLVQTVLLTNGADPQQLGEAADTELRPMFMALQVSLLQRMCYCCGAPTSRRCSGCRAVRFCSEDCQRQMWRQHRPLCRLVAQHADAFAAAAAPAAAIAQQQQQQQQQPQPQQPQPPQ